MSIFFSGLQTISCFRSMKRYSVRPWKVSMTGVSRNEKYSINSNETQKFQLDSDDMTILLGMLRSKARKLNKDFDKQRSWRTSSAPSLQKHLQLSTGSLEYTMSCILVCNNKSKWQKWRKIPSHQITFRSLQNEMSWVLFSASISKWKKLKVKRLDLTWQTEMNAKHKWRKVLRSWFSLYF